MHLRVLCCFSALFVCVWGAQGHKVPVTVYYESLCPDSMKFFTSQLYPALQTNISQWVNLTLVPYGMIWVNHTLVPYSKSSLTCHHGRYECEGNIIQACALHEIEAIAPKAADAGFNPITVALINCLMDKVEKKTDADKAVTYEFPLKKCSEINQVPDYVKIESCAHHTTGIRYLAALGDMTNKLQPPLKSVPTIVFKGKYKAEDSKKAQENFVKALCQYITHNKPTACKDSAATITVSTLADSATAIRVSTLALVLVLLQQLF